VAEAAREVAAEEDLLCYADVDDLLDEFEQQAAVEADDKPRKDQAEKGVGGVDPDLLAPDGQTKGGACLVSTRLFNGNTIRKGISQCVSAVPMGIVGIT
jgi:hypothetical protein